MLLVTQIKRVLYIFAGQRSKEYLNDFLGYHVDTGTIEVVSDGTNKESCQAGILLVSVVVPVFTRHGDICQVHWFQVRTSLAPDEKFMGRGLEDKICNLKTNWYMKKYFGKRRERL